MEKVVPVLIDRARALRDRKSVITHQAQAVLEQSHATLERLQRFRGECLARSPGAAGVHAGAGVHGDYQRFIARLDDAIAMQRQESARRKGQHEAALLQLAQCQQRLLALETLMKRWALARDAKQGRAEQRASDEFAARAARLHTAEAWP